MDAEARATHAEAALALLESRRGALLRTARRFSLCADDAEDALSRAVEILLTRGTAVEPASLAAWMHVVTRHEALGVRRERERLLATGGAATEAELAALRCAAPGPAERAELAERLGEACRALAELKRDQRAAILLRAQGYSYAEICRLRGWSYTKVNRCLAEGRARLRVAGLAEKALAGGGNGH